MNRRLRASSTPPFAAAPNRRLRGAAFDRSLLLLVMLVALGLYAPMAALVGLLGSNHTHGPQARTAPAVLVLEDVRRTHHAGGEMARSPEAAHSHALLQRHRHDPADTSVRALDAAADDDALAAEAGAASAGALTLNVGLADGFALPSIDTASGRWAIAHAPSIRSWGAAPPERPPKA